jgi:hypothetical protein
LDEGLTILFLKEDQIQRKQRYGRAERLKSLTFTGESGNADMGSAKIQGSSRGANSSSHHAGSRLARVSRSSSRKNTGQNASARRA